MKPKFEAGDATNTTEAPGRLCEVDGSMRKEEAIYGETHSEYMYTGKSSKEELELLIPSETVREYVRETGWTFTDFQKAALLHHRGLLLKDEYAYLQILGDRTTDQVLKGQIVEYLGELERGFQNFRQNSVRRCIYVLKVREDGGFWDGEYLAVGYFFDWETALVYGKKEKKPFEIEKYLVDGVAVFEDGTCSHHSTAGIRFDREGEAVCLWNSEEMSDYDNKRFDEAIIEIPNPFERGDIVRCKGADGQEYLGIVEGGREEWQKRLAWHLDLVKNGDTCVNFQDLYISVAFLGEDGTFDFSDSTLPLDLERYEPKEEDWTNGSADTLLRCAEDIYCGGGYLSTFFDMLKRYRQSSGK